MGGRETSKEEEGLEKKVCLFSPLPIFCILLASTLRASVLG